MRRGLLVSSRAVAGLAAVALGVAPSACHTRTYVVDAGADALPDATPADVPGTLALDFAATGCARAAVDGGAAHADAGVTPCAGTPPLSVTFSPVSSAALTRFRWTFGDGTAASTERAPTHTYTLPGTYDVSLVAEGAVGSVSRTHMGFVEVTAAPTGAPCDVDAQCAPGLSCLCGEGAPCAEPFSRGVCAGACPQAGCGPHAACARLDVTRLAAGDAGATATPFDVDAGAGGDAGLDGAAASRDAAADAASDLAAEAPAARDAAASDGAAPGDGGAPGELRAALCLAACATDAASTAGTH